VSNAIQPSVPGATVLASDVNQLLKGLSALMDLGALQFLGQANAPAAPTLTAGAAGLPNGAYKGQIVYATGWTDDAGGVHVAGFAPGAEATITVAGYQIDWAWIAGPVGTVGVLGYRTVAGGASGTELFAFWSPGNTTLAWSDNVADASLGTGMPTSASTPPAMGTAVPSAVPTTNTTGSYLLTGAVRVRAYPLTSTAMVTVLSLVPLASGTFAIKVYFRVTTGTTTVTVQATYADGGGAQTANILPATAEVVGSYYTLVAFVDAVAGTPINVQVQASAANQVTVSASIVAE